MGAQAVGGGHGVGNGRAWIGQQAIILAMAIIEGSRPVTLRLRARAELGEDYIRPAPKGLDECPRPSPSLPAPPFPLLVHPHGP